MLRPIAKIAIPIILLLSAFFLVSCDNQTNDTGQAFDPMESSIFKIADVKNARALEDLEVKAGASESYNTIATVQKGDVVRVLARIDDWYVIRLENYRIGCIDGRKTEPVVVSKTEARMPQPVIPERPAGTTEDKPVENIPGEGEKTPGGRRPEAPEEALDERDRNDSEKETVPAADNVDTGQENQLFSLINQERAKNGLPVLQKDSQLAGVARIKAQDMIDNNYFSHNSPTYGNPFDMMDEFGIEYQYAGENLAKNTSASRAHTALMNSSGHRKNILNPNFTHVGIGVKKAKQGYIYVEMFIGVPR